MTLTPETLLLNKYKIIRQLGEGGMAQVWLAEETALSNRQVAIKEPLPGLSIEENYILQARFEREVEVNGELVKADTPNIVRVITTEPLNDISVLVLEYMPKGDLAQRIEEYPDGMPIEEFITISKQILSALNAIHNHPLGIIHRDIKPSNILFNAKGEACLGDFGLAQIGRTAGQLSGALSGQVLVFTPRYRAPELDNSNAYINTAADIFSFGCVMWEMLTGKVYQDYGKPASTFNDQVPSWLDNILNRCLEKNPQDRFLNAKEVLDSINKDADEPDIFDGPKKNNILERILIRWKKLEEKYKITLVVATAAIVLVSFLIIRFAPFTFSGLKHEVTPTIRPAAVNQKTATPKAIRTPTKVSYKTPIPSPTMGVESAAIVSEIDGMTMVYVPAGEFEMGSDDGGDDESPVHTVYLDAFYIDQTEVTNAQYKLCVQAGACVQPFYFLDDDKQYIDYYNSGFENHPVTNISWYNADDYCKWAERVLPTEAQWEKAARGTDGRTYPWGEGFDCSFANFYGCTDYQTVSVGQYGKKGASPYGAYDMAGNVFEFVADWYDRDYYRDSPNRNPTGPSDGEYRVVRGGSYYRPFGDYFRLPVRERISPFAGHSSIFGFRCALSP